MARIRSIHPGIWTDEAFMALSFPARQLLIGLWTEAFDDGVFEWKPLTLKAKIFPVDNVDVEALLGELEARDCIARMKDAAKPAGAIRNFQRFQRPKKPNSSGLLPDAWRTYVGVKGAEFGTGSEPVEDQSETSTEKSPQMEDGGWRMEEITTPDPPSGDHPPAKNAPVALAEKREARGHRLPDGWHPPPGIAEAEGLAPDEAQREADKFRDYWRAQPGVKGRKTDWDATWRNWIRRAADDRKPKQRAASGGVVSAFATAGDSRALWAELGEP